MTNEKTVEVKKIELAEPIFVEVHLQADIKKPRKEFIKRFMERHGVSKNLAASYYQMLKYEADQNGGRYKHHNKPKKVDEPIAEVTVEEAAEAPAATKPWKAVKGELVQYFDSRSAARAYNTENGGGYKIEKVA